MNLEQLNLLSDAELNDMSAIKVMGWNCNIVNRVVQVWSDVMGNQIKVASEWNPTTDMRDAMELLERMVSTFFYNDVTITYPYCVVAGYDVDEGWTIKVEDDSLAKAITIASILAKE